MFLVTFQIVFRIFSPFFQTVFRVELKNWGAIPFCRRADASKCCEAKVAARQCLPLNCGVTALTAKVTLKEDLKNWMRLFCLQLEASCLQWSFLLTVDNFSFFTYNWSFVTYSFSFFTYNWSFFAYCGKVCLIRALRDCKQRSLTVSKKLQL